MFWSLVQPKYSKLDLLNLLKVLLTKAYGSTKLHTTVSRQPETNLKVFKIKSVKNWRGEAKKWWLKKSKKKVQWVHTICNWFCRKVYLLSNIVLFSLAWTRLEKLPFCFILFPGGRDKDRLLKNFNLSGCMYD